MQADGAGADDDHGVAGAGAGLFEATDDAGERLGEGGVLEAGLAGMAQGIFLDDAGGDADVFGVGAVVEEEVFAEVLLAVAAEEAGVAGGGVEGHDAVADGEVGDACADFARRFRRARGRRGRARLSIMAW